MGGVSAETVLVEVVGGVISGGNIVGSGVPIRIKNKLFSVSYLFL